MGCPNFSEYFPCAVYVLDANLYQRAHVIWYSLCVHYKCKWRSRSVGAKEREKETEREGRLKDGDREIQRMRYAGGHIEK